MHMQKEQLGGYFLGSGVFNFCHCWSLLQRPRQASLHPHYNPWENNSSILMLLLIKITHVRYCMTRQQQQPPKNTLCIHFAFGVGLWTWSTTMLIEITQNSNIFLTLGFKITKSSPWNLTREMLFNIIKELALIFLFFILKNNFLRKNIQ